MAGTLHLDHKLIALVILLLTLRVTNASNTYPTRFAFTPPELEVSHSMLRMELKQGETKTIEIQIRNTGKSPQSTTIELQEQKEFTLASETSFMLKAHEEKNVTLVFTASSREIPGNYTGTVIVRSEYDQKRIMTLTEVLERKPLYDISVKIPEEFKHVQQGSQVEADIEVQNHGDLILVDVVLGYGIKDSEGKRIAFSHETVAVQKQKEIRRGIKLHEDLKPGVYVFYASVEYKEQKNTSSDTFQSTGRIIEETPSLWEVLEKYRTAFIVGITGLTFVVIILVWPVKGGKREGNRKASRLRSL